MHKSFEVTGAPKLHELEEDAFLLLNNQTSEMST